MVFLSPPHLRLLVPALVQHRPAAPVPDLALALQVPLALALVRLDLRKDPALQAPALAPAPAKLHPQVPQAMLVAQPQRQRLVARLHHTQLPPPWLALARLAERLHPMLQLAV